MMTLEYSVMKDAYRTRAGDRECFMSGLWSRRNLVRKVETDWNMAYIARHAGWRLRTGLGLGRGRVEAEIFFEFFFRQFYN